MKQKLENKTKEHCMFRKESSKTIPGNPIFRDSFPTTEEYYTCTLTTGVSQYSIYNEVKNKQLVACDESKCPVWQTYQMLKKLTGENK